MKRPGLSSGLYLLLVFLGGVAVGGFAYRLYTMNTVFAGPATSKPDEYRRDLVNEMRSRLSLTSRQVAQLTAILDDTKNRYHEVKNRWDRQAKEASKPELKAIQTDSIQQIKGILTEAQRVEYDKLRAERDKRRQGSRSKTAASSAPVSR